MPCCQAFLQAVVVELNLHMPRCKHQILKNLLLLRLGFQN